MTSRRRIRIAAGISVLAPAGAVVIGLLGGGSTYGCLGGIAHCEPPPGVLDSLAVRGAVLGASILLCVIAWVVATTILMVHIVRTDPGRFIRVGASVALVAVAAGAIGFANGAQHRLRDGVEQAALFGIVGAVVALVAALAWAGVAARPGPAATAGETSARTRTPPPHV